ncbi:NTP transferase domain-containing protein [Phenylobacterium sp.]|uniref:molybdenum cofactor guanylyltransferase n=1 Tax=Phenylobacterium sp. TaxID=1871053 RepID=UPI002896DC85|nr:NTP transferase domain-containing protein [Phenylobacterium sp.]
MSSRLGAMILAGGASSRMGVDKATVLWRGRTAVERVAALATAIGAEPVITVGAGDYGLPLVLDEQPLGGPVGGVLAGATALRAAGCARALVLAVDAPTLQAADLAPLLAAAGPGAAYEGLHLPMVVELAAIPADAAAGWPLGRLVERAGLSRPACPPEVATRIRGANTPGERDALLASMPPDDNAENSGAD